MQPAQTHVSLELITDTDMYHFIENSILGGVSMITTRYARANAPTPPAYAASRPRVNLIYLDANNLYGWAMPQPLPICGFRFPNRMRLRHWVRWGSYPTMPKTDTYLRWISAIHNIYTTLTTHSPRVVGDRPLYVFTHSANSLSTDSTSKETHS